MNNHRSFQSLVHSVAVARRHPPEIPIKSKPKRGAFQMAFWMKINKRLFKKGSRVHCSSSAWHRVRFHHDQNSNIMWQQCTIKDRDKCGIDARPLMLAPRQNVFEIVQHFGFKFLAFHQKLRELLSITVLLCFPINYSIVISLVNGRVLMCADLASIQQMPNWISKFEMHRKAPGSPESGPQTVWSLDRGSLSFSPRTNHLNRRN